MDNKLSDKEKGYIKCLVETQDKLISKFSEYSRSIKEPQLRIEFQKLCASSRNHRSQLVKLLSNE